MLQSVGDLWMVYLVRGCFAAVGCGRIRTEVLLNARGDAAACQRQAEDGWGVDTRYLFWWAPSDASLSCVLPYCPLLDVAGMPVRMMCLYE